MSAFSLLAAVSGNQSSGVFDIGDLKTAYSLRVSATAAAFSVRLTGSADGVTWTTLGSAVTTSATETFSPGTAARYFRAVLSGYEGPGTVTALLQVTPDSGFTGGSFAPVASPAFTGSPTAPTQATGDASTDIATDAFVAEGVTVETARAETAEGLAAQRASNLSDLASAPAARTNLGLGSAATLASGAVAQTANNLSDLASASTARTSLGLGTAATQASSAFDASGAAATAQSTAETFATAAVGLEAARATAGEAAAQAAAIAASLPALTANVTVTSSAALALNTVTEASAASGNLTMTLPTSVAGALITCEKSDTSTSTVAITGSIRGAGSSTITLRLLNESTTFLGYAGSWWPIAGHKTLGSLDSRYANVFSPKAYGAVGDGTTDDTTAMQACAAAAVAAKGVTDLGTYTFRTSSPVNITTSFHMKGAGYNGGSIVNSASDMFTFASSVSQVTFEGCNFTSQSGGGHVWNASNGPGMSFWKLIGCQVTQNNAAKAIWYQVGGGWIDCLVDQGCYFICSGSATVSPWTVYDAPGAWNSVKFSRMRCLANGATVPFFAIDPGHGAHTDTNVDMTAGLTAVTDPAALSTDVGFFIYSSNFPGGSSLIQACTSSPVGYTVATAATATLSGQTAAIGTRGWSEDIIFDHITWEVCTGGAIAMTACVDVLISMCANWDIPGPRTDAALGGWTATGNTVTDSAAISGDAGKSISGAGIPAGTRITAATATVGYTISGAGVTGTASGVTFTVGGAAADFYSFTRSATGYPCRNIAVRGGRSGATSGYNDFYADSTCTNVLIECLGQWGTAPVISSPAAQTTIINPGVSGSGPITTQIAGGVAPTGFPGATAASMYAGATTGGSPATGTFATGNWVVDQTGSIWICTSAGTPGTWSQVGSASGFASANDPMKIGYTATYISPNPIGNNSLGDGASSATYLKLRSGGYAISNLAINVAASSGNISLAVYTDSGAGASAKPTGGQLAATGAIACPAVGYSVISLGSAITPQLGDWAALSCDNTAATFSCLATGSNTTFSAGIAWVQGAHADAGCSANATVTVTDTAAATANVGLGIMVAPARSDTLCSVPTTGGTTITDTHCVATDAGATVFNSTTPGNLAAGTTIVTVTPNTSFTITPATLSGAGTATQTLLIGQAGPDPARSDTLCTVTSGSATVLDPRAAAADIGAVITSTTTPANFTAGTIITAASAGVSYTVSPVAASGAGTATQTLLIGNQVIPANTTITGASAGASYTISNAAALTAAGLSLTIGPHPLPSVPASLAADFYNSVLMKGS